MKKDIILRVSWMDAIPLATALSWMAAEIDKQINEPEPSEVQLRQMELPIPEIKALRPPLDERPKGRRNNPGKQKGSRR